VDPGGIARPVPAPQAFGREDVAALYSQAATLLLLRSQVRRDPAALAARAATPSQRAKIQFAPTRDLAALHVPRLTGARVRVSDEAIVSALGKRYGRRAIAPLPASPRADRPRRQAARIRARPPAAPAHPPSPDMLHDLARRLARNPSALTAAQLTRASLQHRHELPRVAAAAAHAELASDPEGALTILRASLDSADPLVARIAATALARIAPEDERLRALLRRRPSRSRRARSHTSLLVHGTFARSSTWWQPGGDFHEYLRTEVRPDLYSAADRFEWSGGYSDAARALGAADLHAWVDAQGLEGLDLFTHSHGGSVAMLASQGGLAVGELVMLSCPVHAAEYFPDFTRVSRAVSIRVHMDLVILVDGGGQKFQDPRIEEHVLPIWFDHFATHDPQVWRDHDVPSLI
jgi:hypothetical protein